MLLYCKAHIRVPGQWILSTAPTALNRRHELKTYNEEKILALDLNTEKKTNNKMEKTILQEERVQLPRRDSGRCRSPSKQKGLNAQNAPGLNREYWQIDVKKIEAITR